MRELKKSQNSDRGSILFFFLQAAFFSGICYFASGRGIPVKMLTRDPARLTDQPFYAGFIEQLGVTGWAMAAVLCCLAVAISGKLGYSKHIRNFFIFSAAISFTLFLDDQLQFHDFIFPNKLGISQKLVYIFYLISVPAHFFYFRDVVAKTKRHWLVMAAAGFGFSLGMDLLCDKGLLPKVNWEYFFEDGSKFLGITSWVLYYFNAIGDLIDRPDAGKAK